MKRKQLGYSAWQRGWSFALMMGISFIAVDSLQAQLLYDQDVTPDVIFGSGNGNGAFTVNRSNGVELGMRAKVRFPVPSGTYNSNGDGTYTHQAGDFGGLAPWNFEWSVNTDYDNSTGNNLDAYTYLLEMDIDRTSGVNYAIAFDLISPLADPDFWDHSIGDNTTPNGGGTEATSTAEYATLWSSNNVAQNSWNIGFFNSNMDYDPAKQGIYDFRLTALDSNNNVVAQTQIQVIAVPEPSWYGLSLLLLVGVVWTARRRRAPGFAGPVM